MLWWMLWYCMLWHGQMLWCKTLLITLKSDCVTCYLHVTIFVTLPVILQKNLSGKKVFVFILFSCLHLMPGPASYANTSGSFKLRTWWISEIKWHYRQQSCLHWKHGVFIWQTPYFYFWVLHSYWTFFPHPSQIKYFL